MGKNTNKPVRFPPNNSGGGGGLGEDEEAATASGQEKEFHSKEFQQMELDRLTNFVERPSWEQFKEQQRLKGEAEGAAARLEEEAQRVAFA